MEWKKEYWLFVVIAICLVIYYYRHQLGDKKTQHYLGFIPTLGGALFGISTLINLVK